MKKRSTTPVDIEIGKRIRAARNGLGLTQADLGRAINVTFQQVQKYENGTNRVAASTLIAVAEALGAEVRDLLPGVHADGRAIANPFAAQSQDIAGVELARIYGRLDPARRRSLVSVARAIGETLEAAA